jgi:hypothetical protein
MCRRLLLGLLVLWALSAGRASANDFDGIWSGGYAPAGGKITMQAEFVGDLARFEIEMRKWVGYGERATCQYYVRLDNNAWGTLILNSGSSSNKCAREGRISITRHNMDQVVVSLSGLKEIPDFTLDEVIRPLGDDELTTLPDNFDILGVSLGMTRQEIEKNLIEKRGYVLVSHDRLTIRKANWIAEIRTYRQGTGNAANDEVIIGYSARNRGVSGSQSFAVAVRRGSVLGRESKLTVDVLRQALTRKYGAPTKADDRRYGRDGKLVRDHDNTSQFCETGTRERISDHPFHASRSFQSHCGSELDVYIDYSRSTGFVEDYQLTLTSVDYLNNGRWTKLAIDLAVEIEAFLDAMAGADTSGPEL